MLVACSLPLAAHQKISDNSSGKHPAAGRGPPGTTAASLCLILLRIDFLYNDVTHNVGSWFQRLQGCFSSFCSRQIREAIFHEWRHVVLISPDVLKFFSTKYFIMSFHQLISPIISYNSIFVKLEA